MGSARKVKIKKVFMRIKNNTTESFLLRPLGRLCSQVAFKLDRISTEGTGEGRMVQDKKL